MSEGRPAPPRVSGEPPGAGIESAEPLRPPADRQPLRETLAGVFMIVQGLILLVVALILVATPHSTRCRASDGRLERCTQSGDGAVIGAVVLGGLLLLVVAGALLAQARWARPVGRVLDGLLAVGALAALVLSFVQATPADQSTYAALWVMGAVFVVWLFAPCALLWSVRPVPPPRR